MPPTQSAMDPTTKRTYRKGLRLERAARLALDPAGYTIEQIAGFMGVAPITVSQWRMDPAYHNKIVEIQTGIVAEDDRILRENSELQRMELEAMVPQALLGLRSMLMSKNENIKLKAIGEILDRDGKLAKVSKTSVTVDKAPSMTETDIVANELRTLFASAPSTVTSNFTVTANEASAKQEQMQRSASTSLEDIDLSGQRPQ